MFSGDKRTKECSISFENAGNRKFCDTIKENRKLSQFVVMAKISYTVIRKEKKREDTNL
jgi:hypothetical protein